MAQLEAIIARMESGEIGLEAAMAEYERGVALARRCREILGQAEQKLEALSREDAAPPAGSGSDGPDEPEEA